MIVRTPVCRRDGEAAIGVDEPAGRSRDIEGIPVRGRYIELVAPKRVVLSRGHAGSETLPPDSTEVRFTLTAMADGGTLVEVEHRNLPDEHVPAHRIGWPMFMGRLQGSVGGWLGRPGSAQSAAALRSAFLSILPNTVVGNSSTTMTRFGTL